MTDGSPQRPGAQAFLVPDQVNQRRYEAVVEIVDGDTVRVLLCAPLSISALRLFLVAVRIQAPASLARVYREPGRAQELKERITLVDLGG